MNLVGAVIRKSAHLCSFFPCDCIADSVTPFSSTNSAWDSVDNLIGIAGLGANGPFDDSHLPTPTQILALTVRRLALVIQVHQLVWWIRIVLV